MDGFLAHNFKQGCCGIEACVCATDHKGQRAGSGAAGAARNWCIQRGYTVVCRGLGNGACAVHIDGRTIQQHAAACHCWYNFLCHRAQNRAIGQHGDDHVGLGDCRRGRGGRRHSRHDDPSGVKTGHAMTCLHEVGGHRRAHITQTDKAYFHSCLLKG